MHVFTIVSQLNKHAQTKKFWMISSLFVLFLLHNKQVGRTTAIYYTAHLLEPACFKERQEYVLTC